MEYDELLFKLLYHRKFRELFLNNQLQSLNLSDVILNEISVIDREQLTLAAQKCLIMILGNEHSLGLKSQYPLTLAKWKLIFSDDTECFELVYKFLESSEFEQVNNVAFNIDKVPLFKAFYFFLINKLGTHKNFSELTTIVKIEHSKLDSTDLAF